MANYHEFATRECTKQSEVGLGYGSTPAGESRICVALGGGSINPEMEGGWGAEGWISLTEDVAAHLYELLSQHFASRVKEVEIGRGTRKYRLVLQDGSVMIVRAHLVDIAQKSLLTFIFLEDQPQPTRVSRCHIPIPRLRRLVFAVPLGECKEIREIYDTE